jgi:hypothetical protein
MLLYKQNSLPLHGEEQAGVGGERHPRFLKLSPKAALASEVASF